MPRVTKKQKKRIGRPPLAPEEIRMEVRLDRETDRALTGLAKDWGCTRSEAMRRAVKTLVRQRR